MIRAPFNFIPLSNKVYFPYKEWNHNISLDIPFADGISGMMELSVAAETPLFIRNGQGQSSETKDNTFSKTPGGKYFIPSSSIKGCIRNVLEILSFGKMRVDKSSAFAQREWDNDDLYPIKKQQSNIKCGWLIKKFNKDTNKDEYSISVCKGYPMRINLKRIDEWIGTNILENHFSKESGFDINKPKKIHENEDKEYDPKTACYKYALLKEQGITKHDLRGLYFSEDDEYSTERTTRYLIDDNGSIKGTLILTGQPDMAKNWNGERKLGDGKFYEFIFPETEKPEQVLPLSEEVFDNYKFIYADSPDWKEWEAELSHDGIPVFLRTVKVKDKWEVKDFGMAFLYRLPYENTPFEIEEKRHPANTGFKPDLSECIFGFTEKNDSLKGRVQFSNFISEDAVEDREYTLVLNSPKASYYPFYIRQDGRNGVTNKYKTYNDGQLAGYKRYYLRNKVWEKKMDNPNIDSVLHPVKSGSIFKGKVIFHNLTPVELGALVASITFLGNDSCRHQIGQAKPYGFGKVKISIDSNTTFEDNSGKEIGIKEAMARFEYELEQNGILLSSEETITQLISMSSTNLDTNTRSDYMILETNGINEFVEAKKRKEYLQSFTSITGNRIKYTSTAEQFKAQFEAEEIKKKEDARKIENLNAAKRDLLSELNKQLTFCDSLSSPEAKNVMIEAIHNAQAVYDSNDSSIDDINISIKSLNDAAEKAKKLENTGKYGKPFAEFISQSLYIATDFDKWIKTEGNVFGDKEYCELIKILKSKGDKECKNFIKKSKYVKSQGKTFANKIESDLKKD